MKLIFVIFLIILTSSCTTEKLSGPYLVIKVVDGDTIKLNTSEKVRLSGINTPKKKECHHQMSTSNLTSFLLYKEVFLERDITNKGKYGRILRYVYHNGEFINGKMVQLGYARVYDKYANDTKYYSYLKELELVPKSQKQGVWAC